MKWRLHPYPEQRTTGRPAPGVRGRWRCSASRHPSAVRAKWTSSASVGRSTSSLRPGAIAVVAAPVDAPAPAPRVVDERLERGAHRPVETVDHLLIGGRLGWRVEADRRAEADVEPRR